jgi:hypothetical protein
MGGRTPPMTRNTTSTLCAAKTTAPVNPSNDKRKERLSSIKTNKERIAFLGTSEKG